MMARCSRCHGAFPASRRLWALLLAACVGFSGVAHAEPAQPDAVAEREREARAHYDDAAAAYQSGRYQQAITLFLAADRLAPSPALSFNVARAYERLGDGAGALKYYREYLRRELAPVNLSGVRARIAELEAELAARGVQQVTVLSEPPGAFVSVDGEPRGPTPWTGELVPGNHELTLLKEGYVVVKRELVLEATRAADVSIALERTPQAAPAATGPSSATPDRNQPRPKETREAPAKHRFGPLPWITLGVGGAALLAAGGFEVARAGAEDDARSATTQIDYADAYNAAHSHQTTSRVLLVAGGALVVTGGILLVIDVTSKGRAPSSATARCTTERCVASFEGTW